MIKVLVVGQTPPPYHGQAISIQLMLNGKYQNVRLYHVRMSFSKEVVEIGKFRMSKLWHLLFIIISIYYKRFRHKINILYYVPAGPNRIPMYRDFAILLAIRYLFKKIIFHFRAAGISELYGKLSAIEQFFFRLAYFNTDLAISLSEFNPLDGEKLKAKRNIVIPNGLEDCHSKLKKITKKAKSKSILLFVGILRESKGIMVLLDASRKLKEAGLSFLVRLMGRFESANFSSTVERFIYYNELAEYVEILGECTGDNKWNHYNDADIFVFPTFFENEGTPRVILESMHCELPIIATRWRGIPSMIVDGKSGFLMPINDSQELAEKIAILLKNPEKGQLMGKRGRQIYLEKFTAEKFWHNMEEAFISVG